MKRWKGTPWILKSFIVRSKFKTEMIGFLVFLLIMMLMVYNNLELEGNQISSMRKLGFRDLYRAEINCLSQFLIVNTGSTYLGRTSPCPSCPSLPFPQVHTSVLREGRRASASPLYVGVRTTVRVFTRAAFLKSLGETENKRETE